MVLARGEMTSLIFPNGFFQSVGLLACTTLGYSFCYQVDSSRLTYERVQLKCIRTKNCIRPPSQKRFAKDHRRCTLLCVTLFR